MPEANHMESRLRPMAHEDLALVFAWRNHPEIRRYMYTQHEITLHEHQHWFERALPDPKKHLLIFESNQQPIGFVNLNASGNARVADWGFYIAPSAPKGSGRQLGRAALNYAFGQLALHKVCGEALAFNQRSVQFHQALGFQQEGISREQHFDGSAYHHVIRFGLLSQEWQPDQ